MEQQGRLGKSARSRLLTQLTPDVATLVLRNNHLQSQALSILQMQSLARANEFQVLIRTLERKIGLNRRVERLPDETELSERYKRNEGLTRPELAVVFSYAKMDLYRQLLDSPLPEDPYFTQELSRYFPTALQKRFTNEISRHRLRREIIVTATINSIINRMGPAFALRAAEESASAVVDVARAYSVAREAFDARDAWSQLEAMDGRLASEVQYRLYGNIARGLRHATMWFLEQHGADFARGRLRVIDAVEQYASGIRALRKSLHTLLSGTLAERYETEQHALIGAGVAPATARTLAAFPVLEWTLDVIELASSRRQPLEQVARCWFQLPVDLKFDQIEGWVDDLSVPNSLHAAARRQLRVETRRARRGVVESVLEGRAPSSAQQQRWQQVLMDMQAAGQPDHAMLSVCVAAMRQLTRA